jgi:hypothetical protein
MNQLTTTNTPTEYFKCNICNRKFAIPKKKKGESSFDFNAKYERKFAKLLSDMRKHIDKHRQERSNRKIPAATLHNLFTKVQVQQGKDRGRPKGRKNSKNGLSSDLDDGDAAAVAPAPTRPKPR